MSANGATMTDSTLADKMQWSLVPTSKPNIATEDHLQSLGLDANDGLPKFKFNEPGPAALASSIFQQNNMVNDESDQSFVVLGKSSFESIRDLSLASYIEIQQKTSSVDHTSMISFMSPSEIEENLKKVLDENTKLKETLKQNNNAIKQQFNTITMWQNEVMTVCDNHKQKFLETKELISKLRKENEELRVKIEKTQTQTSSSPMGASFNFENENMSSLKKSNYHSSENLLSFPDLSSECLEKSQKSEDNTNGKDSEQDSLHKINTLSEELNKVKLNYSKTQQELQDLEKRYMTDLSLFSQQLQKANQDLEMSKQNSDSSHSVELQKLVNKCCEKDMELKYLNEIINNLKLQVQKYEENALPLIELENKTSDQSFFDMCSMKESIQFYNERMGDLSKCFASQCSQYMRLQELLKECADILHIFENADVSNSSIAGDNIKVYKDKLSNYRKGLINEQLQSIEDKQTTIKVQKYFQKILADYNSVNYELEITKDENLKLITLQTKAAEENSQKLIEIEKKIGEEKKLLEDEKMKLSEELLNLQIEKKIIAEQKDKLEAERNSLSLEKEKLIDEKIILLEERTSLDRQSKLYEVEEGTLHKEKKDLQKKCEDFAREIEILKQELDTSKKSIQQLQMESNRSKELEGEISAYKIQTEIREKEFEEMRENQRYLQDQLRSLSNTNVELQTENERLGGQPNEQNSSQQSRYCGLCANYIVPGERHGMGICTPEFD